MYLPTATHVRNVSFYLAEGTFIARVKFEKLAGIFTNLSKYRQFLVGWPTDCRYNISTVMLCRAHCGVRWRASHCFFALYVYTSCPHANLVSICTGTNIRVL